MTSGKKSKATRVETGSRQAKIDAAAPRSSNMRVILGSVIAAVLALAVGLTVWFGTRNSATDANAAHPAGSASLTSGIVVNQDAPAGVPTLDIYQDAQCPVCKSTEQRLGDTIDQLVKDKKVKVVLHQMTFLERRTDISTAPNWTTGSTRGALALFCAADAGKVDEFNRAQYDQQPEEGLGLSEDLVKQAAKNAGLTGSAYDTWQSCFSSKKYADYAKSIDEQSSKDGVNGTPTYKINGNAKAFDPLRGTPEQLTAAIAAAGTTASGSASASASGSTGASASTSATGSASAP